MSAHTNNISSGLDNLLLQTLMGRLQVRPPPSPFLNQTLEDLLFDQVAFTSDDDYDYEDDDDTANYNTNTNSSSSSRTKLSQEEAKLEKEIIRTIITGKSETLQPNSGQAVTIGEHHICVGFHEDPDSDYRVWEWHGHIMLFDDEDGYSPEYIYGNYFERLKVKSGPSASAAAPVQKAEEKEEKPSGYMGLKELVEGIVSGGGRILHRNVISGSPRFE